MANDKFTISEALKYGWDTFKANILFFIGLIVVMVLITVVPDRIAQKVFEPESGALLVTMLFLWFVGIVLSMITTRITLDIHDYGRPTLARLKALVPSILPYIGGKLLFGLLLGIGLIVFIVPGVIVSLMFLYVGFLIVDRQLGPIEALGESRAITDGYKWDLCLFNLVLILLNLPSLILMIGGIAKSEPIAVVGLFLSPLLLVSFPVTLMASTYVYRRLSPAVEAASEPA